MGKRSNCLVEEPLLFQLGIQLHCLESALTSRQQGLVQVPAELAQALGTGKLGKLVTLKHTANSSGSKATLCFYSIFCCGTRAHFPWGRGRGGTREHICLSCQDPLWQDL